MGSIMCSLPFVTPIKNFLNIELAQAALIRATALVKAEDP